MSKFAIIEAGGKQYKVALGDKLKIEKVEVNEGENVCLNKVLLIADGDKVEIGDPYIKNVAVEGTAVRTARTRKKIVFHYSSKTRYRKKNTHRQYFTEVEIVKI